MKKAILVLPAGVVAVLLALLGTSTAPPGAPSALLVPLAPAPGPAALPGGSSGSGGGAEQPSLLPTVVALSRAGLPARGYSPETGYGEGASASDESAAGLDVPAADRVPPKPPATPAAKPRDAETSASASAGRQLQAEPNFRMAAREGADGDDGEDAPAPPASAPQGR